MDKKTNKLSLGFYYLFKYKKDKECKNVYSLKETSNLIIDKYNINNLDSYILQGITIIGKNLLITAYDSNHEQNSKIYIIDKNHKIVHTCTLDTKAHVGGITYDSKHKTVWITDKNGFICCYKYEDIKTLDYIKPIYRVDVHDKLINSSNGYSVAYITYHNGNLYLGNFNTKDKAIIKEYKIDKDGTINNYPTCIISGVDFTQGITFLNKGTNTYLIVSSSYGFKKSLLRIYKVNSKRKKLGIPKVICIAPPMLEQIILDSYNNLLCVFESNAKKYQKYKIKNNDVIKYEISKIIKRGL